MSDPLHPLTLLEAFAREEGYFTKGTRANRNRNPGNIEDGPWARRHGAYSSDGRFAIFPTAEVGWAAMRALFEEHYAGLTVAEAVAKWAPPAENDTEAYIERVCHWANVQPNSSLDAALGLLPESA